MKYDLVIFDLDGTLLDTLADLTNAVNHALEDGGFPKRSIEEVRRFIGNGVARLMRLAAPEGTPDETIDRLLAAFKAHYTAHVNDCTRPFDGIPELLDSLRAAGLRTAVNSNKMDAATQQLCASHFGGQLDLTLGERPEIPKKPLPEGALHIMRTLQVPAERTLYVGDGDTDLMTARNAGIDGAWVSWGYRRRDEIQGLEIPHAFHTVSELRRFILED